MLKNLDPKDISIKPFKSFKNFTFTNNDSGSGVWLIKARSGAMFSYVSSSDSTTSIVSGILMYISFFLMAGVIFYELAIKHSN